MMMLDDALGCYSRTCGTGVFVSDWSSVPTRLRHPWVSMNHCRICCDRMLSAETNTALSITGCQRARGQENIDNKLCMLSNTTSGATEGPQGVLVPPLLLWLHCRP